MIRARVRKGRLLEFGKDPIRKRRELCEPQQSWKPLRAPRDLICPGRNRRGPRAGVADCPVATVVALTGKATPHCQLVVSRDVEQFDGV